MTRNRSSLSAIVAASLLTLLGLPFAKGQEYPNPLYKTNQFNTTVSFRQSICDRHQKLHLGEIESLDYALEGLELRPHMKLITGMFELDEHGRIDPDYPGLTAVLLDEVARRGKFTWRNSFATLDDPMEGKGWTDLVTWSANTYDISVAWWAFTVERISKGIAYPESWLDGSYILVGPKTQKEEEIFTPWSWLAPFDLGVWGLVLATFVFSGFIYCLLELVDPYSDKRSLKKKPIETMFMSAMGFTGHMEFETQTHPARLFTFSLAMWALLMGAAYTANLASFLVVKNSPKAPIQNIEDAVRQQVPICVFGETSVHEQLRTDFPNAVIVEQSSELDTFKGISDGECAVAFVMFSAFESWKADERANPDCQLVWLGRKYKSVAAGFATWSDTTKSKSGTLCTSLVRDVFNLHLLRMKEEGFIEESLVRHRQRTATIDCSSGSAPSSGARRRLIKGALSGQTGDVSMDAQQLSVLNMGGIFLMHGGLSLLAVILALIHRFFGLQARRDKERREQDLRRHLRRSEANRSLKSIQDPEDRKASLQKVLAEFSDDDDEVCSGAFRFPKDSTRTDAMSSSALEENFDRINMRQDEQAMRQDKQVEAMERLEREVKALTGMLSASKHSRMHENAAFIGMDGAVCRGE